MADVMRRFGWLVFVVACQSAAPTTTADSCHHDSGIVCFGLDCAWDSMVKVGCKGSPVEVHAFACKDGSGRAIQGMSYGPFGFWYDGKGKLIGSWVVSDDGGSKCQTEYWGTQLACDLTPIDLPCATTP